MRGVAFAALVAALTGPTCGASAAVTVSVKNASYSISGRTGDALLAQMDRHGPKHGLLTRAIAQTRYSVGWDISWATDKGTCKVETADARLMITYTYPKIAGGVPPALAKRWARFMRGVKKHEEMHGAIARQMVVAAEKAVADLKTPHDPSCSKTRAETKRRADAIYAQFERRQMLFDTKEHGDGGAVEKLIIGLRGD